MNSLVSELQQEALDSSIPIADLLRKALVVSVKLDIKEFKNWIESELNGYSETSEIPQYRWIGGEVRALNPYRGWIPIVVKDPEMAEIMSKKPVGQAVGEIEQISRRHKSDSLVQITMSKKMELDIMKWIGEDFEVAFHANPSQIYGIAEAVRTIILNWSLKLETDGIFGEGMSFSKQEKEAASSTTYNIQNFISQVTNSQIQQDSSGTQTIIQNEFDITELQNILDSLKQAIDHLPIQSNERSVLESDISTIESQIKSPKPKASIIRESLVSVRTILEGAAGSILASELLQKIIALFN